jgi:hypothetical protein
VTGQRCANARGRGVDARSDGDAIEQSRIEVAGDANGVTLPARLHAADRVIFRALVPMQCAIVEDGVT